MHAKIAKCAFSFFFIAYLIYSGLGGALKGVSNQYFFYYIIFTLFLSIGIFIGINTIKNKTTDSKVQWNKFLDHFIKYQSKRVILIYYVIKILGLIIPEFKLMNIIHPPAPDVMAMLDARYNGTGEGSIISSFLTLANQLTYPFFLLSLYRYKEQTIKLSLIVIGTYYITYCQNAYLGRGSMLEALIIIVAFTYFYRPKLARWIIGGSVCLIPVLLVFLVQYSIKRIGGEASTIGVGEAMEVLISQEGAYPLHFTQILNIRQHYIGNYLIWLVTMPLPGLFRGGIDANFNALFSEHMLGIDRTDRNFFILLPGIVGESVFLLGKSLFWINGIIYGLIVGITYKILSRFPQMFGILIVAIIDFSYGGNRGGVVSAIPFILKILVYFYILLYILKTKYNNKIKTSRVYEKNFNGRL